MAKANTNSQPSSSNDTAHETDAQTKDDTLEYSEEPCELSEDQLTDDLAFVPLDEELNVVPVEEESIEQDNELTNVPREAEDDVDTPLEEELESAVKEALAVQEGSQDDDVADIEPAAGDEIEEPQSQIQNQSQADAQDVAQIEPEAGENAGAAGITSSGRGYGFQSSFDAQGVINLEDVGPIDPTALEYGIPQTEDKLFYEEEEDLPDLNPTVVTAQQQVYEDGSVLVNATISGESSNSTLTVTISGIPAGWSVTNEAYDASSNVIGTGVYNAAAGTWTITTSASTYNGGPIFSPPADSDVDALNLTYAVVENDPTTGQTGTASAQFDVIVDAVADQPDIDAQDNSGAEGVALAVNISGLTGEEVNNGAGGDDGSESVVLYEIAGVPAGFTLSAGTETAPGSGVYVLTPAELVGLTVTPNDPNFAGSISLVATIHTTENTVTDTDFDFYNNDAFDGDAFTLTWKPDADKPALCVDDAYVKEDGSVFVPVSAQLADTDGSEFLTITVSGIPSAWNFSGAGWTQTGPDTYEIVVAAGSNYADGFTVRPPHDSDVDLPGITVTATATEISNNDSEAVSEGITVYVDAVADVPRLYARDAGGEEGTTISLTVSTSVTDTDGSEVIEVVKISNVPAGMTLTAGTYNAAEDTWYLDVADLAGLGIVVPDGNSGTFYLNVESVAYEQNTSGSEIDLTDNRASAFETIKVIVSRDDVPRIKDETNVVDETDMNPSDVASGNIHADFGSDTPGDVSGNGAYDVGTLTSNGTPVVVTYNAATDTYTGTAGTTPVFTLVVQSNGDYTFTLLETIDHPDATNHNDYLTLDFGVTATDSEGDTTDAEIHIRVYDDGPVAADDQGTYNAAQGYYDGNALANDTESKDEDNTVTEITFGTNTVSVPADGSYASIDGTYGTLKINNAGDYTYTLFASSKGNSDDEFTYTLTDGDSDTDTAKITFDIDPPAIDDKTSVVDETDMNPTDSVTATLNVNFGADTPGDVSGNGSYDVGTLVSNGTPVVVTYDATTDTYTGTAGTTSVFTLVVQSNGQYTFTLLDTIDHPDATNHNDFLTLDFGVTATDSEGETTDAEIHIRVYDDGVTAVDDQGTYNAAQGYYDGNALVNDNLSQDEDNSVTEISFGTTTVAVPTDGTYATINGAHGTLEINIDGDYNYTLFSSTAGGSSTSMHLDPTSADVAGTQDSITKDGITVSVANAGNYDISWMDTHDGSGLGIDNLNTGDSHKVWPDGEAFDIDFAQDAKSVTLTIGELGSNNNNGNHGLDFVITFADGTQITSEQQFVANEIQNGYFTFTIKASDYGTQPIQSLQIYSTNAGQYARTSFLLNDVEVKCMDTGSTDEFTYTLVDGDGDSDQAVITFEADPPAICDDTAQVDETDMNPTTYVTDVINANFGADTPGDISGNGTYDVGTLTSNGVAVVVTYNAATDTYTGTAGTTPVFTLAVQSNGQYTFTLLDTIDHPDATNHNDYLTLDFGVTATDSEGEASDAEIHIRVYDDGPKAADDQGQYNAAQGYYDGNVLANDTESKDQDNDITEITFGTNSVTIPTDGTYVSVAGTYGTLRINNSGDYTYTMFASSKGNSDDQFTYTLMDGDNDTDTAVITFDIDPPIIDDKTSVVDETDMNPTDSVTATLNVNFGADTPGDVSGNGTYDVGTLTSNGTPVVVAYNAATDTYTGTAGAVTVFTLVVQSNGQYTFTLVDTIDHPNAADHNDFLTLDFGVTATDSEGETTDAEIHIKVYDDGPVAADDTGTYNAVADVYDGNALANDTESKDQDNTITQITFGTQSENVPTDGSYAYITGTYGTLRINNAGDYDYTLYNSSLGSTDEFTYTLVDGDNDSDTAVINFDIDPPVIKDDTAVVDETDMNPTDSVTDSVYADFGNDTPGDVSGNGTYDVGNLMSNNTPVVVTYNAATDTYTGTAGITPVFTLVIQSNGQYTFTLLDTIDHPNFNDHNDFLTLDFGVTATDSEGETADAEIHIKVYDDGLTAVDDRGTYNATQDYYEGNALANDDLSMDQDNFISSVRFGNTNLGLSPNGSFASIDGTYGTLRINSAGDYTYTLFSTSTGSHTDEFTYTVYDGDDDSDQAVIKFEVDPPVIKDDTAVVDETDMNPTDSVTDAVSVNFGNDTPGDVSGNGTYDIGTLTSEGDAVSVAYNAATDTYTGTAGGRTIFTLVVQSSGQYTFTLVDTIDHPDTANHNDYLTLDFGVTATDSEGETADAEIHIKVYDDGPVAADDFGSFKAADKFYQGNTFDNDTESKDQDNDVTLISYGTNDVSVPTDGTDVRVDGNYGYLTISNDGEYTYTLFDTTFSNVYSVPSSSLSPVQDQFTYTLTDGDGDTDTAIIKFDVEPPKGDLIVGQNVDDDEGSTVPHLVNGDYGVIDGGEGADILVGDAGGSTEVPQTQDYNFLFVLDFSGSMGSGAGSQIELLKEAVSNLVLEFSNYQNGEVVVHFVPFANYTGPQATFTITDAGAYAQFESYINGMSGAGYTNYEHPLQQAIAWLQGSEPLGGNAITTTYFVSDGEPNYFMNTSGNTEYGSNATAMGEILGTDGTNEVAQLQGLSDDVIAVGIDATSTMMNNLDQIDSGSDAINIDDAGDLSYVFAATSPLNTFDHVGDDMIVGGEGDDLIFGDVLYTDYLADQHGFTTEDGAGWEVFERLENGESTVSPGWTRSDTVDYILAHSQQLAQESVDTQGNGRTGGDDRINGGDGDDTIFAQEGNDVIYGGEGDDVISGGSGADTFLYESVGDGFDTITDFDASEGDVINLSSVLAGFDPLADSITDFVMATSNGGNTTLYVDVDGSGSAANMVELVTLEGVGSIDLNQVIDTEAVA